MTSHENGKDAPQHNDLNLTSAPNLLTTARVLLVPGVVYLLFQKTELGDFWAAALFTTAAITDYFDGYLARRMKLESVYGKLMDPLADKFLVVSALCMLQEVGRIHPVVVILLICREMAITGLRAVASTEGLVIAASSGGKWKTAAQMFALPFLMLKQGLLGIPVFPIGQGLIYLSLTISLWSAKDYIVGFFRAIGEKRRLKRERRKALKAAKRIRKSRGEIT